MIQTLDVQVQNTSPQEILQKKSGLKGGEALSLNGKTGAETARNGSSFLAMIEKMIASSMEGPEIAEMADLVKKAVRGAGGKTPALGEAITNKKDVKEIFSFAPEIEKENLAKKKVAQPDLVSKKPVLINSLSKEKLVIPLNLKDNQDEGVSIKDSLLKDRKKTGKAHEKNTDPSFITLGSNPEVNPVNQLSFLVLNKVNDSLSNEEGENEESLSELKGDRKGKKVTIGVKDERTNLIEKTPSLFEKKVQINDDNSADISIGFRPSGTGNESASQTSIMAENKEAQGGNFASMLSQELQSNASDFVKTGQIVLRDNNSGIIRLNLHPESLGNVQIKLELIDRKISGKIVVNSKEAWEAFNESMDSLNDAFIEGGFETGGFDLSWSGNESAEEKQHNANAAAITPFYASSIPDVMSATETADVLNSGYRSLNRSAINVFA